MEKFVFREFMNKEVIQKVIIFADAFNLNIDNWRPANTEANPYRINFYSGGVIVGYIDAEIFSIGTVSSVETDMPFVLFTPFGKMTGYFSTHFELFKYAFENKNDDKKIEGLFRIKNYGEFNTKYDISSTLEFTDEKNVQTRVNLNKIGGNYIVEIVKTGNQRYETVRLHFMGSNLCIDHFHYPKRNQREDLATIKINLENREKSHLGKFGFLGHLPYAKIIEQEIPKDRCYWENLPYWKKIDFMDYEEIKKEIELYDARMISFLNEVRDSLTWKANGITPISIYDKIANSCFGNEEEQFQLAFTEAQDTKVAMKDNLVLKKMMNYKRTKI